ncbi:MAG: acyltransferase [Eubacterium sp.]|nr:acyltransferase [Eubacterium sp.]
MGGVDSFIGNRVSFGAEPWLVTIGSHVRITEDVRFITHDGGLWVVRDMYPEYKKVDMLKPIFVGNNVHIGINAVIMPGVHIGNNCIIGVGAVVTKDIPDNSIAVGVPARVIETVDEYVQKNKDKFINTKGMTKEQKKNYIMKNLL